MLRLQNSISVDSAVVQSLGKFQRSTQKLKVNIGGRGRRGLFSCHWYAELSEMYLSFGKDGIFNVEFSIWHLSFPAFWICKAHPHSQDYYYATAQPAFFKKRSQQGARSLYKRQPRSSQIETQSRPINIARVTTDPEYWVHNLRNLFLPKLIQIDLS